MGRRQLLLGREHDGTPVSLAIRGRTILIAGEPGSGKSYVAGLLCEQLILQGYSLCIIDPEGDYRSLETLPGVIVLGGDDPPPHARDLSQALRHPDVSVIIDLSKRGHYEKIEYIRTVLPLLGQMRRRTGLPHRVLLDEAHYFLNGSGERLLDPELAGYLLVTYRVSALPASLRDPRESVVIVTRETDAVEIAALRDACAGLGTSNPASVFPHLATNEAALLPGVMESRNRLRRFEVAPRMTAHVRHQAKYLDMPVADAHAFVFVDADHPVARVRTLKELIGVLTVIPAPVANAHLRRHDFSRWIDGVFHDHPLAAFLHGIEARVDADGVREVSEKVTQAIRARYETGAQTA